MINVSFKRQRKPKGLKLVSWLKILFLKNILLSNIHELVFVFNVWYKLFLLILTLTFGILIKVVRVMKGMSKQFCEYSLGIQKKICQYSFYDKYVFCTVFLTFHNITYNAVKQILIVYKFFMSLNESVKETNIFFYTLWSFCKILLIFISSLFNFLDYKKGYVTYIL